MRPEFRPNRQGRPQGRPGQRPGGEPKAKTLLTPYRDREYHWGYNEISDEAKDPTGIGVGLCKVKAGQELKVSAKGREVALLGFLGKGVICFGAQELPFERLDWEVQAPSVVHVSADTQLTIRADTDCEVIVCAIANPDPFDARAYRAVHVQSELRGHGILEETATRIVRTVFDFKTAPPASKMVLGEVVNFPGKWSSYPPHKHAQPEVYFYRFKMKQGYGHGEVGEEVYKVRDGDLLRITDSRGHSQTAAPGYAMYYLWAVRHLPGRPYTGFSYYKEHEWTLQAKNKGEAA